MSAVVVVQVVLGVAMVLLLVLGLLFLRRVRILRRGGVDVALRATRDTADDGRWRSGLARYRGDEFRWYRVSGLRAGPNVVLDRTEVEIVDRRGPRSGEMHAPSVTVLSCRAGGQTWELAMEPDAVTGFSSWLESTPPGRTGYRQAS